MASAAGPVAPVRRVSNSRMDWVTRGREAPPPIMAWRKMRMEKTRSSRMLAAAMIC